ncbi:MAG: LOG family protein [Acidobacteriota bacterium]
MNALHRALYPDPPGPLPESRWARLRRRWRRRVLRVFDRTLLFLYRLIAWLDDRAPVERRYFRVAIFGSSRIQRHDPLYHQVRHLARRLSEAGCDIVTGGGPGLMTAANEGAREGAEGWRTRSFGLTILLPFEEQPNPFLDEVSEHHTFFSRLHHFIRMSHAYVVVDGGLGTTLEALMVWQLLQVGLLEDDRELVFVGPMWEGLRRWVEADVISRGLASAGDLDQVHWVASTEEALTIVRGARRRFIERRGDLLAHPRERRAPSPAGESTSVR